MLSPAADHLRRLQDLLAAARADYDVLSYIILEGAVQVTFQSLKRRVTIPVGEDAGHYNGLLEEAARLRVEALEKEVVEAHDAVVSEFDGRQLDDEQLTEYRQRARAVGAATPIEVLQPLVSSTQAISDAHSP